MLKSKKGIDLTLSKLGGYLLLIIGFIVVLLVMIPFAARFEEKAQDQKCHASVVARAAIPLKIGDTTAYYGPLACETQDKEIEGNREEIKEQMARMMERCWWMFNEGRQDDILDDPSEALGFDNNVNKCFLCYTAEIDQDEIVGGSIGAEEMFKYLNEENHPKIAGMSYLNYIQSYGGPGAAGVLTDIEAESIYGVVYLSKSKEDPGWTWAESTAAAAIVAGGLACLTGIGCVVTAAVAGTGYLFYRGEEYANFYGEERSVSTITIDKINNIEAGSCKVKDFA